MDCLGIINLRKLLHPFDHLVVWSSCRSSAKWTQLICTQAPACIHPLQITFPQHVWYLFPKLSIGTRKKQIGHSSSGGGCVNNASLCISTARFLHSFLCCGQWAFWHSALQYFTILHVPHFFRLSLLSSPLPQLAHVNKDVLLLLPMIRELFCWCTLVDSSAQTLLAPISRKSFNERWHRGT